MGNVITDNGDRVNCAVSGSDCDVLMLAVSVEDVLHHILSILFRCCCHIMHSLDYACNDIGHTSKFLQATIWYYNFFPQMNLNVFI